MGQELAASAGFVPGLYLVAVGLKMLGYVMRSNTSADVSHKGFRLLPSMSPLGPEVDILPSNALLAVSLHSALCLPAIQMVVCTWRLQPFQSSDIRVGRHSRLNVWLSLQHRLNVIKHDSFMQHDPQATGHQDNIKGFLLF